jgi:transcription antitermination factor NusG
MNCSLAQAGTLTEYVVEPDMRFIEPHWYAVYTRSRHEQFVKKQLDGKEVENFLPLYEKISQWKDRKKAVTLPLFPGYLFVRIPLRERVKVLKTFGAVNIVGNGQGPLPIPEDQIQNVQSFVKGGLRLDPHPYLKLGNKVRICEGPLEGMEGILIRKKNQVRLVVSVDLIQRSVSVEIDSWKIQRV